MWMENKKVSIIVPVYNVEACLERCVLSLVAQTYQNIEILLIDDGSKDGSGRICERLSMEHEAVSVYHRENGGVSKARNEGIDRATGEYLTFVDADDFIHEEMIERLLFVLQETGSGFAGCGFLSFTGEAPAPPEDVWADMEIEKVSREEFLESGILGGDTRCWSKLYRRDLIGNLRFKEGLTIGEDMLFLLELSLRAERIGRVKSRGYYYYSNQAGAMNRKFVPPYMDQIRCWRLAEEKVLSYMPRLSAKTASIRMISAMLVAGKISELGRKERAEAKEYVDICRKEIKECLAVKKAVRMLSVGYQLKVLLFVGCPGIYLGLYGKRRRVWEE